ncbi:MAG: hypothetical protein JXB38_10850 [Anaerolineales bacterium]|nr:hypothetical protein [Anaerolineales bacterium]
MSIYDYRDRPAYRDDFRPYANKNIAKWWGQAHDDLILELIKKWQWHWYWEIAEAVLFDSSQEVIDSIKNANTSYNEIMYFAITRAKKLGLTKYIREPDWKLCPLCKNKFIESSLPHPLIKRLGIENIDYCSPCLRDTVLQNNRGNDYATKEQVLQFIKDFTNVLQRIPRQNFGEGINDFHGIDREERLLILQQLQKKPSVQRVKELFGSWLQALIEADILDDDVRRTSRGIHCIANDGHICFSLGEKTIDDYLFSNDIPHEKEQPYPEGKYRVDFVVNDVFIEYFGLKGNLDYDKRTEQKQKLCKKHNIKLVALYPSDLVSIKKLERKLQFLISKWVH